MGPVSKILCVFLLAVLCLPAVAAQNATQADVQAVEDRLSQRLVQVEGNLSTGISAVLANLSGRLAVLEAQVAWLVSNVSTEADVTAAVAAMTGLQHDMQTLLVTLQNETFADHVKMHRVLVGQEEGVMSGILEEQERMVLTQVRFRGDLDAINSTMSKSFARLGEDGSQILSVADAGSGKATLSNVLAILQIVFLVVVLGLVTGRPRRLWAWMSHEAEKLDNPGQFVDPPCPKVEQGVEFGQYHVCPFRDACGVASECRDQSIENTEHRVMAEDLADVELEVARPVVTVTETRKRDLTSFGR